MPVKEGIFVVVYNRISDKMFIAQDAIQISTIVFRGINSSMKFENMKLFVKSIVS